MSKRKTFRRVKVGNRGYHAGKRQAMFLPYARSTRPAKSQTFGNLAQKTAPGAANTESGKAAPLMNAAGVTSVHLSVLPGFE